MEEIAPKLKDKNLFFNQIDDWHWISNILSNLFFTWTSNRGTL